MSAISPTRLLHGKAKVLSITLSFLRRNYNGGRNRKKPVNRAVAMEELLQVIKSRKPDKYTPKIVEKKDDYVLVEYESPILGFVDDVVFWFPPGKNSVSISIKDRKL
ncbi:hypothetical protein REPUB_Repub17cG0173300 [Reevesia pubescens]